VYIHACQSGLINRAGARPRANSPYSEAPAVSTSVMYLAAARGVPVVSAAGARPRQVVYA
jgi:hypothetical protein